MTFVDTHVKLIEWNGLDEVWHQDTTVAIKDSFLVGFVSFTCLNVIQSGVLIKYKTKLQLKCNLFESNNACQSIISFVRFYQNCY